MYYVDIPKVRGKMAEHGYTVTSLAKKLGINRNTLAFYLCNPSKIPQEKLSLMATLLCDDSTEAASIFFATDFRKT